MFFVVGLFMMLTSARKRMLDMVNGNVLAFICTALCAIMFALGFVYLAIKSYAPDLALEIKQAYRNWDLQYFVGGSLFLMFTYAFANIDDEKLSRLNNSYSLERARRYRTPALIIGTTLGLMSIAFGLSKLFR